LQQRRERAGDHGLLISNQARVGANRFHKNARGEQIAVRVENVRRGAARAKTRAGVLLRLAGQFVVTQHLQIHEPVTQAGKCQAQQAQQCQHPFQLQPFAHRKKTANRPRRSVPQPMASRAAAKIFMSYGFITPAGFFRKLARQILVVRRCERGFRQPHYLHRLRRRQAEIHSRARRSSIVRRPQNGKLVAEFLVVVLQSFQADFALPDLLAELVNLVLLPDETHRRPAMSRHKNNAFSAGPNRIAAD